MGMFAKPKPKTPAVPKGSKETFVVRYPGGRKPFPTKPEAMTFATEQRAAEKGWAEVTHSIETVVSPR